MLTLFLTCRYILPRELKTRPKVVTREDRLIERAEYVIKSSRKQRYHKSCLLRLAQRKCYESNILVQIVTLMRTRRQHVLKAAYVKPFLNPQRTIRFLKFSFQLLSEMEDLFEELYAITGDKELYRAISEARFVTPEYLGRLSRARKNFLQENHGQRK